MHTWAKCPVLSHDSFLAGHFSCGLWALYPHLSHFRGCSLLCLGVFGFPGFLDLWVEPFLHASLATSTLWYSPDITCIPSLVASNIRQMSIAVSRARFLLFSKQRCRTRSSSDLHTMALRIDFSVSVISWPRASGLKSVTIESNVALSSTKFDRRHYYAGSSWRRGVLWIFGRLFLSTSFSLTISLLSPDPIRTVSHWKVK